jgi:hypothetical protein
VTDVPLWLALVAVLLLVGYLSANTFIGTALGSVLD